MYLFEAPTSTSWHGKSLAVFSTACSALFVGTNSGVTVLPSFSAWFTTAVSSC